MKKDLVQIIKDNPGCLAIIDNDSWSLERQSRDANPFLAKEDAGHSDKASAWDDANKLASDRDDFGWPDGSYAAGGGCSYGGDILQALAVIAGITVKSV